MQKNNREDIFCELPNSTLSEHLSLFAKLLLAVGGIDGGLPFAVARLHLAEDLLERGVPPLHGPEMGSRRPAAERSFAKAAVTD